MHFTYFNMRVILILHHLFHSVKKNEFVEILTILWYDERVEL